MARCLEWSLAWWAALLGCTLHLLLLGGQMCRQLTAVTPAHLCIHPAMPPLGTCTLHWAHAGTQSTNTRSISPALPISMERRPQAGPNSLETLLQTVVYKLQACQPGRCKASEHFQSSTSKKKRSREWRVPRQGGRNHGVDVLTIWKDSSRQSL